MEWIRVSDNLPQNMQLKECKYENTLKRKNFNDNCTKIQVTWLAYYEKGMWHPQSSDSPVTHWRDSDDE
jgi:hypothetical protein